jgi:hypothetical protein
MHELPEIDKMKITKNQLRRIIRESLLLEWSPEREGETPPGFRDHPDMEITFTDVPEGGNSRKVTATAIKNGVSFEGDPAYYTSNTAEKVARMAYDKAAGNARLKHDEDK